MNSIYRYGRTFYSEADIDEEILERYLVSHYEVWLNGQRGFLADDNLWNLDVDKDTRTRLLKAFTITKDDTVLEIGAYNGLGTVRLSELSYHVIAVEADESNFEVMRLNTQDIPNVTIINKAVSDGVGYAMFYKGKHPQGKSLNSELINTQTEYSIETDIIDNFVFQVTYVTMEINMGEANALKGMVNLLNKCHPKIIMRGHNDDNVNRIKTFLERHGYEIFIGKQKRIYAL